VLPFCLTSRSDRAPLRIGLLLDAAVVPRWTAAVLEYLAAASFVRVEIVVILRADSPRIAAPESLFARYERWDRGQLAAADDPLVPVDCADRLRGVSTIMATPIPAGPFSRLPAGALDRLRTADLDVILHLGSDRLGGDVVGAARHGVWAHEWADGAWYRGGPPYFWETCERHPLCGAALVALSAQGTPASILCKGLYATQPGPSQARNGLQAYWGATFFVIQTLHALHESGPDDVARRALPVPAYRGRRAVYATPSDFEMARWLGSVFVRKVAARLTRRREVPVWKLAVRVGDRTLLDEGPAPNLSGFTWLDVPRGRFYADPFFIEESGRTWLFFEDADLTTWRGAISAAEVRADGRLGTPVRVLEQPYHLSYPHVIRDGGDLFMIPETQKHGTVELYRCERFPDRWQLEKELYRGLAVDTTVWIEHGVYWFFVTLVDRRGGGQLWLFFARALTGDWTPHPANPISRDVRRSRGGGAIFRDSLGRLIRPSQDGSVNYGRSFSLNEITVLDEAQYAERTLATVEPPPGFIGTHSYARAGRIEIVDGIARVPQRVAGGRPPDEAEG
jgi:hypothetical protein